MTPAAPLRSPGPFLLTPFYERYAPAVANWVLTPEELGTLAPSSDFPLTADSVRRWVQPSGTAYLLVGARRGARSGRSASGGTVPVGYGELNPMRGAPDDLWMGHVVVDPQRRGVGLGSVLTRLLVEAAFARHGARRLSLVVFPGNVAAIRCYRRAGFRFVREERHRFGHAGLQRRLERYEVVREAALAVSVGRGAGRGDVVAYDSDFSAK